MHPRLIAQTYPERPAYIIAETGESISYGELEARANQIAHVYRQSGLQNGDHIAILLDNDVMMPLVVWGAQRTGLLFTCISTHLNQDDVAYIINDCQAKVLVSSSVLLAEFDELKSVIPGVGRVLLVDGSDVLGDDLQALAAGAPVQPVQDESPGVDMLYSSGTTGRPKGVATAPYSDNVLEMLPALAGLAHLYGFDHETVYLSPAPLYHAAPLRFNMIVMSNGGTCIIMRKFDPERALALIEQYRVTHSQWVPIMFSRMLKAGLAADNPYDLSSHRLALHAAAPCPIEVKQAMLAWWGPIIEEYYSSTEGIGFTTINSADWLAHPGSVGRPVFGEIHILDEQGQALPVGTPGLVYFANGPRFTYFGDAEKTASATSSEGWLTVGDIGYVDSEGFLYLTDRQSFMIISGGVNIYPQEVENALMSHPAIKDVAVFGVPSEQFGEEVKAVVEPLNKLIDREPLAADIMAFCRARLSAIKCPKSIDFIDNMPRLPNGKLFKKDLRARYQSSKPT